MAQPSYDELADAPAYDELSDDPVVETLPPRPATDDPFANPPDWMTPGLPKPAKPYEEWTAEDWRKDRAQWDKRAKLESGRGVGADTGFLDTISEPISDAQEGLIDPATAERMMRFSAPAATAMLPGVTKSLAETASGFTSPLNMLMLGGGGELAAIPKLGAAAVRGLAGGFAVDMAKHLPELAEAAGQAQTFEEKQKAYTDLALNAGMAGLAGLGTVVPAPRAQPAVPPKILETFRRVDATVPDALARTKEAAVKRVAETTAKEPVAIDQVQQLEKPITAEGVINAETIRSDPGQVLAEGRQPEVVQDISRQDLQQPTPEPAKPLGTQGSTEAQVPLETGTQAVKRVLEMPDEQASKLNQKAQSFEGVEFSKADLPAIEEALKAQEERTAQAIASVDENRFKAETGRSIWLETAKEAASGRVGKGTNWEGVLQERAAEQVAKAKAAPITKSAEISSELVPEPLPEPVVTKAGGEPTSPAVSQAVSEAVPVEPAQSMGGLNPKTEQAKAQLAQLTDSIATLAAEGKTRPSEAFSLGETLSRAKDSATAALEGLKAAGTYMKQRLEGKPITTEYKGVLGDRHLALSESSVNARKWRQQVLKAVPDPKTREAISNWVDAGGDSATLTKAAAETKPRYKEGYERAQNLTPEERTVAENLKNYFDSRLQEAIDAGVLEEGIENYIHRTYEQDSPWKKGVIQELRSGLFTGKPALAKKRIFEYDFEAEKAGKRPVKDFAQRVTAYDLSLNKAIADRAAVKAMMEIKMSDGRPMIDVGGGGKVIENAAGEPQATIINRSQKKIDPNDPKADRGDYKPYDHPALRKWKWATEDTAGNPVFVQGDVLIHPEAIGDLQKLLGRSAIRQNPIGRAALGVSSTIKQTMLDLSGFHPVQIAVHGTEHRTFAPVKEIDFTNPDVRGLIRGGAAVGETSGHAAFSEGLSGAGSSLTKHIPWVGERLQAYNSWLFEDYIPRLKVAMGLHALERNKSRFKDLSQDQLYQLTADQMNAAFGEQNYTMLGRSKTTQDALRLALLAPDFLEARGRFAAQAFTKYGAEQRQALILGAVTMYITARLLNKMMSDEYHFEPKNAFNLVVDGKSYGLRTVQGDLIHAATDPGKFINHRLNPVYGKPALEFVTGRDYFGRKRTTGEQLADFAKTPIPIGVRGAFEKQEQTLLDSFLNSFGLVTKRDSPSSDISQLAQKWKEKNDITTGPGEFIYDAEKDPYRPIKLAAERDDEAGVRSEVAKAMNEGISRTRILEHFKLSERHNFAGSAANERKFVESLTEDEKKIYADAKEERKRIRVLVRSAMP